MSGFSLEPLTIVGGHTVALIARGGALHARFGDPYTWACVIVLDGHAAHFKALCTRAPLGSFPRHALADRLRADYGITAVRWERMGRPRDLRFTI